MNATSTPNLEARHADELYDRLDASGAILTDGDRRLILAAFERHMMEVQATFIASLKVALPPSPVIWN